jgi:ABC-type multidrug transport system permease subunit
MGKIMSWLIVIALYLFGALFAGLTFAVVPVMLKMFTASNLLVVFLCVMGAIISLVLANKQIKLLNN